MSLTTGEKKFRQCNVRQGNGKVNAEQLTQIQKSKTFEISDASKLTNK